MNLQTIEMPVEEAQKAFREYRSAIRLAKTAQVNSEDAQIARCYKALAEGRQVLNIEDAFEAAGLDDKGLPQLAISRADYERCLLIRSWSGEQETTMGPVDLTKWNRGDYRYSGEVFRLNLSAHSPVVVPNRWRRGEFTNAVDFAAIVPNIPPALRPPHALSNYHLLWEPHWEVAKPPPPKDPALLKHLGGPLYAVLATWELTPVEQAVLGVTRN